jgi:hypothetical protein
MNYQSQYNYYPQ